VVPIPRDAKVCKVQGVCVYKVPMNPSLNNELVHTFPMYRAAAMINKYKSF
jgi:hypothetical protein